MTAQEVVRKAYAKFAEETKGQPWESLPPRLQLAWARTIRTALSTALEGIE